MTRNIQAVYLHDGYRPRRGLTGWYRDLTVREAKMYARASIFAVDWHGQVREVKHNGRIKTWKTKPGCVLSLKYGLRDCFHVGGPYLSDDEPISTKPRIVVPVRHSFLPDTPPEAVIDWVLEHEIA